MGSHPWSAQTEAVWECIQLITLGRNELFTLEDIYIAEPILQRLYPENKHIKAKIRQQLQVLRDHKYLEFVNNNGTYRRLQ